ncbi:MAG: cohesin domain-containing protein, partial [Patescibacteria group bacterium]
DKLAMVRQNSPKVFFSFVNSASACFFCHSQRMRNPGLSPRKRRFIDTGRVWIPDTLGMTSERSFWHYLFNSKFLIAFVFAFILLSGISGAAHAASLSFSPVTGSYTIGQTFSVGVRVSSTDQPMNAADGVVSFPPDKLEVASLSKSGSIMSLWVQEPSFSNSAGTINFEGIVLNPGFTGSAGKLLTITFKAKGVGNAPVTFNSGSVLANDGKGTNIVENLGSAIFAIGSGASELTTPSDARGAPLAPHIVSSTNPDPARWYNNPNPKFSWAVPQDVTTVQILVGKFPSSLPTVSYSPAISEKEVADVPDGEWYIHVRFKNAAGWGAIAHFKFQIDTKPPDPFPITFLEGRETDNPRPSAMFTAIDDLSGIDHYKVKIGEGDFFTLSREEIRNTSFMLPLQAIGKRTLLVQAYDRARNITTASEEFVIKPIAPPVITEYPRQLESDQVLIVKGTSPSHGEILFSVQEDNKEIKTQKTKVDDAGNWSVLYGEELPSAIYKIFAQAIDKRGAISEPTPIYFVSVGQPAFFRIGNLTVRLLSSVISILALLLLLALLLWLALHKIRTMRKKVKREVREAEHAVHRAFDFLKEEIHTHVKLLEKAKTKRDLSEEEEKILIKFKHNLDEAELIINKEISDIEGEVK